MGYLEIRLLGPPRVGLGGEDVTEIRSEKVRALLAYLVVEADQPHRREKLAGLLWPGYPEASARASLRRALADLRKALRPATDDQGASPPYLDISRQTIQYDKHSGTWMNVTTFNALVRSPQSINEETLAS